MTQLIVISAVGTDRTGVVQDITKDILECGGNIEESRMTTLGAEFAMLLLVSGNWHTLSRLEQKLEKLTADGNLNVSIRKTVEPATKEDRMPYAVDVVSLDQQGIVDRRTDRNAHLRGTGSAGRGSRSVVMTSPAARRERSSPPTCLGDHPLHQPRCRIRTAPHPATPAEPADLWPAV